MQKILIIEDNQSIREEIFFLLSLEGFDVIQAENGLTGLQLAKEENPDIIISDIEMPFINGFGVLEALRKNTQTLHTPVLFITGNSNKVDLNKIYKGMNFLLKPFSSNQLLEAIYHLPVPEKT